MAGAAMAEEEEVDALRAKGNALYKKGLYPEAIAVWADALALSSSSSPSTSSLLLSNRAQAYLQLREPGHADRDAARAIRLDPTNTKAIIRRATALLALERHEEAGRVLEKVPLSSASLPSSLAKTVQGLREQITRIIGQSQGEGANDAPAKEANGLVDEAQTLRLYFRDEPPTQARYGQWVHASLFLANEFGLWRRTDFPLGEEEGEDSLDVGFSVYDHGSTMTKVSETVGVEVVALSDDDDDDDDEEESNDNKAGRLPALQRGSSCRLRVKLRFHSLVQGKEDDDDDAVVLLMVSLPHDKLLRQVLPVFSLPIHLSSSSSSPSSSALLSSFLGVQSCRGIYIPALGRRLLVAESPGQVGLGGKIWDAGLVLTHYLAQHPEVIVGDHSNTGQTIEPRIRRVIELGAGTGVAGIAASLLGAEYVIVSDLAPVVPLIEMNVALNVSSDAEKVCLARAYAWGEEASEGVGHDPFDVILLADVIYEPKCYPALKQALLDLSHADTVITLAHRERHPDCALFFAAVDECFERKEVPFRVSTGEGKEAAWCQDVVIFEMRRKDKTTTN